MLRHRHLPHLRSFNGQPIVFITAVTHDRVPALANPAAFNVLTEIWRRSPVFDGWFVGDFVLMPDHVNLFARSARDAKALSDWIKTWKSLSSRQLTSTRGRATPFWQRDYFDRFLRSAENYQEKWDYVAMNPVRRGLCARPRDWPWRGRLFDLMF